ncbi:MAG: hypothetical protein PHT59_04095 [Candidatus Omnitrophica bacterium]|nr:hypothetical protein [Candidatus Omnitrophota bacterium]
MGKIDNSDLSDLRRRVSQIEAFDTLVLFSDLINAKAYRDKFMSGQIKINRSSRVKNVIGGFLFGSIFGFFLGWFATFSAPEHARNLAELVMAIFCGVIGLVIAFDCNRSNK